MNDKIITHEDLNALRAINDSLPVSLVQEGPAQHLLDRLIAAAEADQPPLPLGTVAWVTKRTTGQRLIGQRIAMGCNGTRPAWQVGEATWWDRDLSDVEPLDPTVTAEQRDRVADEIWDQSVGVAKSAMREAMVDAFKAAEIEVSDR